DPDIEEGQRPLLILVRQPGGTLALRKKNERIVLCSTCGGVWGDPFAGLTAKRNSFTVEHYGGSASRWGMEDEFAYSRRDTTWQLVRVKETSHHTLQPNSERVKTYRPPRDFGKIDFSDFDPANFKNVGPK